MTKTRRKNPVQAYKMLSEDTRSTRPQPIRVVGVPPNQGDSGKLCEPDSEGRRQRQSIKRAGLGMKPTVAAVVLLVTLIPALVAQEKAAVPNTTEPTTQRIPECRNEVQLRTGFFSQPPYAYLAAMVFLVDPALLFGEEVYILPSFTAEYMRNLTDRHAIGGTFTYAMPIWNRTECDPFLFIQLATTFKYRFSYLRRGNIRLYSSLALGFDMRFITNQQPDFQHNSQLAAHATLFGVQFGGEKVFGSAEIGIGMEGTGILLGVGTRF